MYLPYAAIVRHLAVGQEKSYNGIELRAHAIHSCKNGTIYHLLKTENKCCCRSCCDSLDSKPLTRYYAGFGSINNHNFKTFVMTTIKTSVATINGKKVTVETLHGERNRQDIQYRLNGKVVSFNNFWALKPKFKAA